MVRGLEGQPKQIYLFHADSGPCSQDPCSGTENDFSALRQPAFQIRILHIPLFCSPVPLFHRQRQFRRQSFQFTSRRYPPATRVILGSFVWIPIREATSAAAATSFVLHCVIAAVYAFPGTRVMLNTNAWPYLRYTTLGRPFSSLIIKFVSRMRSFERCHMPWPFRLFPSANNFAAISQNRIAQPFLNGRQCGFCIGPVPRPLSNGYFFHMNARGRGR